MPESHSIGTNELEACRVFRTTSFRVRDYSRFVNCSKVLCLVELEQSLSSEAKSKASDDAKSVPAVPKYVFWRAREGKIPSGHGNCWIRFEQTQGFVDVYRWRNTLVWAVYVGVTILGPSREGI